MSCDACPRSRPTLRPVCSCCPDTVVVADSLPFHISRACIWTNRPSSSCSSWYKGRRQQTRVFRPWYQPSMWLFLRTLARQTQTLAGVHVVCVKHVLLTQLKSACERRSSCRSGNECVSRLVGELTSCVSELECR